MLKTSLNIMKDGHRRPQQASTPFITTSCRHLPDNSDSVNQKAGDLKELHFGHKNSPHRGDYVETISTSSEYHFMCFGTKQIGHKPHNQNLE